ncbi:MAG: FkbM family methyltransferase [Bacillota bacterium]
MRGTYIGNRRALVWPLWGGELVIPSDDLSMAPDLLIHGLHEPELTHYFLKNIKEGFTVVDLGANLGYFTVLLGHLVGPKGKVIAYEADPRSFSFLMDNISINYFHDHVTIHNKAVYSSACRIPFYSTGRFRGNSSIYRHGDGYFKYYNDSISEIEVEAEPLDIYLGGIESIDLVKMDIEGGEYQAFMGMAGLIGSGAVGSVVFEMNRSMMKSDWGSFCTLLRKLKEKHGALFYTLTLEGNAVPAELEQLLKEGGNPGVLMKLGDFTGFRLM